MANARDRLDLVRRLTRVEEELRRQRLHNYGEGSGSSITPFAAKVYGHSSPLTNQTVVDFQNIEYNTTGADVWDISLPNKLVVPDAGIYLVAARAQVALGPTAVAYHVYGQILVVDSGGATVATTGFIPAGELPPIFSTEGGRAFAVDIAWPIALSAGDKLDLRVNPLQDTDFGSSLPDQVIVDESVTGSPADAFHHPYLAYHKVH